MASQIDHTRVERLRRPVPAGQPAKLDALSQAGAGLAVVFPLLLILTLGQVAAVAYLAFAFAGSAFLYAAGVAPSRREWLLAALAGGVYCAIYVGLGLPWAGSALNTVLTVAAFLGAGSLTVNWQRTLGAEGNERKRRLEAFLPAAALPVCLVYTPALLSGQAGATPISWDKLLYLFDGHYGIQAGFFMGRLFAANSWLAQLCMGVYLSLPLALGVVYGLRLVRGRKLNQPAPVNIMIAFALIASAGFLLFPLIPAAGPIYAFPDVYPYQLPEVSADSAQPFRFDHSVRLNAIPSVHTALALLVFWCSRGLARPIRIGFAAFLVLTLMATLGLGEHYLVDLVVGFPFAVALYALTTRNVPWTDPVRLDAFRFGTILVFAWFGFLRLGRFDLFVPAVTWAVSAATVAYAMWLVGRLQKAASRC